MMMRIETRLCMILIFIYTIFTLPHDGSRVDETCMNN